MDGDTNVGEVDGKLAELSGDVPFSNGFFYGLEGRQFTNPLMDGAWPSSPPPHTWKMGWRDLKISACSDVSEHI